MGESDLSGQAGSLLSWSRPRADDRGLHGLCRAAEERRVRRRQPIYLPGDSASELYLVKQGRVKISNWAPNGKEVTFAILHRGEWFGELEVLEGTRRQTCAQALDDATLGVIRREEFLRRLQDDPGLAVELTKVLGARLRALQGRVEDLVFHDVPARILHALVELSTLSEAARRPGCSVEVRVTHQELANLIGCNRETVSAVLSQFRRNGLVRIERESITILDMGAVARHVA